MATNSTSVSWGIVDSTTADIYIDDLCVNDSAAGGNCNTWPGGSKLVLALPTGAGDFAAEVGTASSINEIPPSNNSTGSSDRIELQTTTSKADFAMTDSGTLGIGSGDTIVSTYGLVREAEATSGTTNYTLRLKSAASGTVVASASVDGGTNAIRTNPGGTAFALLFVTYVDPTTGVAWTPTGTNSIDNMQYGAATTDGSPDTWVLWLGLYIEYIPAAPSNITVTPGTLALVTATFAPVIKQQINAGLTTLALATFAPSVIIGTVVTPGTLALTTTTYAPQVNGAIIVPVKALTLTTYAPQVNSAIIVPATALTLTTFAPTILVSDNKVATPGVLALVLATFAPVVTASDHKTVTPDTLALSLSTFAPVITVSDHKIVTPGTLALILTTYTPTVSETHIPTPTDNLRIRTVEDTLLIVVSTESLLVRTLTDTLSIRSVTDSVAIRGRGDSVSGSSSTDTVLIRSVEDNLVVR